jgi:hypothetical protein
MAPAIHRLGRLRPLAPRGPGIEARHRLMTPRFIQKDQVLRIKRLHGVQERCPFALDIRSILFSGAKRFFARPKLPSIGAFRSLRTGRSCIGFIPHAPRDELLGCQIALW